MSNTKPTQSLTIELRSLRAEEHRREASDRAVSVLWQWLHDERLVDVEELLRADPTEFHPAATLAILTMTRPDRIRLTERDAFVRRAEKSLAAQLGSERAERLLRHAR